MARGEVRRVGGRRCRGDRNSTLLAEMRFRGERDTTSFWGREKGRCCGIMRRIAEDRFSDV